MSNISELNPTLSIYPISEYKEIRVNKEIYIYIYIYIPLGKRFLIASKSLLLTRLYCIINETFLFLHLKIFLDTNTVKCQRRNSDSIF